MKKIIYFITICTITISCGIGDGFQVDGIRFSVFNETDNEYESAKFYIGKYDENDSFIATDSLIENRIILADTTTNFNSGKGWFPDLDKISPSKGGFLMKLSDGREYYFKEFTFPKTGTADDFNLYIEDEDTIYWPG